VLAILEETAVQLISASLRTTWRLSPWVREANIHWDRCAHAASLGLPATAEHTWRFGLDRLLLG
jgi:exodeoxyribonuclease V gamma subunit